MVCNNLSGTSSIFSWHPGYIVPDIRDSSFGSLGDICLNLDFADLNDWPDF